MQDDEQEIRNLIAEWSRATAAGDVERVLSLTAEDVVFLLPGRPPMRGRSSFKAMFKEGPKDQRIQSAIETEEIKIEGNIAYTVNHLEVTKHDPEAGPPTRLTGYVLSIFRKEPDGRWVLARDANLLTPESAPS